MPGEKAGPFARGCPGLPPALGGDSSHCVTHLFLSSSLPLTFSEDSAGSLVQEEMEGNSWRLCTM